MSIKSHIVNQLNSLIHSRTDSVNLISNILRKQLSTTFVHDNVKLMTLSCTNDCRTCNLQELVSKYATELPLIFRFCVPYFSWQHMFSGFKVTSVVRRDLLELAMPHAFYLFV